MLANSLHQCVGHRSSCAHMLFTSLECVAEPLDSLIFTRPRDGYDIKTTWALGGPLIALQIVLGGRTQLRLLAPVDAFGGRPVVFPSTRSYLDEDDAGIVLHDQ